MSSSPVDRSRPPASGGVRVFPFPEFETRRLANGLRLVAARVPGLPLVHMELLLPAGGVWNPPEAAGLASLNAALLDEGTEGRSALEIAARVEELGGMLGSAADWNTAYVLAELLASHAASGLEILAEIAGGASFPEAEVERLVQQRLAEIARREQQPSTLAELSFARGVFGETILAEPLIGTRESLEALGREDCVRFYERHCRPGGAALVMVGDHDMQELLGRSESAFGGWRPGEELAEPDFPGAHLPRTRVVVTDRPGAAQTELRVGHLGVPRSHPGYPARLVLNTLLGGKFTSRLNLNLREKHGFTYGVQSHFIRRRGASPFVIRTAVGTESVGAALGEIVAELRRIRDEPVDREELLGTREYLAGVFPYTLQTAGDVARRLADLEIYGLGEGYYDSYPAELLEVSAEEVQAAARELLRPEQLMVAAAGPGEQLVPQLEAFGPVEILPT